MDVQSKPSSDEPDRAESELAGPSEVKSHPSANDPIVTSYYGNAPLSEVELRERKLFVISYSVIAVCAVLVGLYFAVRYSMAAFEARSMSSWKRYYTPSGEYESNGEARYVHVDWNAATPILYHPTKLNLDLANEKKLRVAHCEVPAVFEYLRAAKRLEILELQVRQSSTRCDFTGVNALNQLRTLNILVFTDYCDMAHCELLAQCDCLEYILFYGGVRLSAKDLREIAGSKTIESLRFEMGCDIASGALTELHDLKTLKEVSLDHATIDSLNELSQVRSLEIIRLGYDTDPAITTLAALKSLPALKLVSMCVEEGIRREKLRSSLPDVELELYSDPR